MCKERFVTPLCCEAAKTRVAVYLHWKIGEDDSFVPAPNWILRMAPMPLEYRNSPVPEFRPKFCPFCGTSLPEVERNPKPRGKICTITDGGYYCDTCKERLMVCDCFSPEFAWRVKNSPSISGSKTNTPPEMEE